MPTMLKSKFINAPDRGVDRVRPSNAIGERQWLSLAWTRGGHRKLERLPGYDDVNTGSGTVSPTTLITMIAHFRKSDNYEYHFVADKTTLYRYDPSTKVLKSAQGTIAAFGINMDNAWATAVFLDNFYVNSVDAALYKNTGTGNFSAAGGDTFAASCITGFKNHLLAAGKSGDPLKVFWAADGTETFTAASTNDAGSIPLKEFSDLPQKFLQIGPDLCMIYGQRVANLITYVGGDAVFAQANVSKRIGILGPSGVVDLGLNRHFLVAAGDFYIFDGLNFKSVGADIRDAFFNTEANINYLDRVRVLYDQITGLVYVFFVSINATVAQGFYPDTMYVYDTIEEQWYGPTTLSHNVTATSELTGTFVTVIDSIGNTIDTVSLLINDTHAWTGTGAINVFGTDVGKLFGFNLNTLNGSGTVLNRSGVTGDKYIGKPSLNIIAAEETQLPNKQFYITRVYYDFGDDDLTGTITIEAAVRQHLNDAITYVTLGTISFGTSDSNKGHLDYRFTAGKWIRFRITGTTRIALRELGWDYYEAGRMRR